MNTPDKCPKCGASRLDVQWVEWVCGNHPERHRDSSHCLTNQRNQLAAWKESAQSIISEWHDTWLALGSPGPPGRSMALCVREHAHQLAAENAALRERVKRLEEAGDSLADATIPNGRSHERWKEAKEAQP